MNQRHYTWIDRFKLTVAEELALPDPRAWSKKVLFTGSDPVETQYGDNLAGTSKRNWLLRAFTAKTFVATETSEIIMTPTWLILLWNRWPNFPSHDYREEKQFIATVGISHHKCIHDCFSGGEGTKR